MSTNSAILGELTQGAALSEHPEASTFLLDEQGPSLWKRALTVGGALLVSACSSVDRSTSAAPSHVSHEPGQVLFDDNFNGYSGEYRKPVVVTGEGSHFSPGPGCPTSNKYDMTSGTLIVYKGKAITGNPTTETGDVPCDSITHNDNNIFRLLTKKVLGANISISLDYTPLKEVGPASQHNSFDGFTIWAGNQPNSNDEDYSLYTISIRDGGEVVIKKKVDAADLSPKERKKLRCTGDMANGGGYFALSQYIERPDLAEMGRTYHVVVKDQTEPDGDVELTLDVNGHEVISATDTGAHGAPYRTGQVGVRLDYTEGSFDNFEVSSLPSSSASPRN